MKVNGDKLVYELVQFIKKPKSFPQTTDLAYKKGYYAGLYDASEALSKIINELAEEEKDVREN